MTFKNEVAFAVRSFFTSEIFVKAANTFWQTALAVIVIDVEGVVRLVIAGEFGGIYTLAIAGLVASIAAGLSAVKTYFRQVLAERVERQFADDYRRSVSKDV